MALTVDEERSGAVTIAVIGGRLDGSSATLLDDRLSALVTPNIRLVLDMSGLDYVSSAGLRVFLKTAKQTKAAKGSLALSGITDTVSKVFEISGFNAIFVIRPDRQSAIDAIS